MPLSNFQLLFHKHHICYNGTSSGGFTTLDMVTSIGIDHMPPNQMSDVLNYGAICFVAIFMSQEHSKAHHIVGQQLAIWTCVAILSSGIVGSAETGLGESPGRFLGWVPSAHPISGLPYPSPYTCLIATLADC